MDSLRRKVTMESRPADLEMAYDIAGEREIGGIAEHRLDQPDAGQIGCSGCQSVVHLDRNPL